MAEIQMPPHPIVEVAAARDRYKAALEEITKMGRVCPEYEVCDHPWCSDSCGAVLTALAALRQGEE